MSAWKICVTFLLIALSSLTAQAAPTFSQSLDVCSFNGGQVKTITQTITAASSTQTSSDVVGHKNGGGNSGINNNSNDNNAGTGSSSNGGNGSNSNEGSNGGGSGSNSNEGSVNNNGGIGNNSNGGSSNSNGGNTDNTDVQSSLTLDPRAIATGFENDGQDVPTDGQVASLTSSNNFINFCLTVPQLPITNGKQITNGSCNPAPIGLIPTVDNMPSSKFSFPLNFGAVKTNTAFTIKMQIQNMQTGFFVNAQENYFAAPQQLNNKGQIQGHSHVVIEQLDSIEQTMTTNPQKFAFFKGLNDAAVNGLLTADVTNGLPAGAYKLSSINSAANHQPVIVPIAQHGSLDDAIYFFVTDDGKPPTGAPFNSGGGAVSSVTSSASSVTSSASSVISSASSVTSSSLVTSSSVAIPSASTTGKDIKGDPKSTSAAGNGNEQPTATVVASHKAAASAVSATATATGKVTGTSTASTSASAATSAIPSLQGNKTVDSGNDPKDSSKVNKTSVGKEGNADGKN